MIHCAAVQTLSLFRALDTLVQIGFAFEHVAKL